MIDVMQKRRVEFQGESYETWHGSPFDRGSADSYYGRVPDPHYWPLGTYKGHRVDARDMTVEEIRAYMAGYDENEAQGSKKQW